MNNQTLYIIVIIVLGVFLWPLIGHSSTQLHKILQKEPDFSQIVQKTMQKEGISGQNLAKWQKKSKKAAFLPQLYVGFDQTLKKSSSNTLSENISVSSSGVTIGPDESDFDFDRSTNSVVRVRAVWKLDELIFPKATMALQKEKREQFKLRLALYDKLYQTFSKRREIIRTLFLNHKLPRHKKIYLKVGLQI